MLVAASLLTGLLFGMGLVVSGMVNPAKIIGFLDLAGAWDPSLALVMAAAVAIAAAGYLAARRRTMSLLGAEMKVPAGGTIDRRLVLGSLAFGVGWGIGGLCPGPGLVALGMGEPKAIVFVASMLAGMALFEVRERRKAMRPARAA